MKISFLFALKKNNHMPTQITPNVSFTNVSRELRCKWRDEASLSECQDGIYNVFFLFASSSSLRARRVEKSFVFVVTPFFTDLKIHMTSHVPTVIDAHLHRMRALSGLESIHRVVCGDCHDFKLIVTLNESNFAVWECDEFTFEADVVKQLEAIDGVSAIESQTYTFTDLTKEEVKEEKKEEKEVVKKVVEKKEEEVGVVF